MDVQISLLWPAGRSGEGGRLDEAAAADLGLDDVVRAMLGAGSSGIHAQRREYTIRQTLAQLIIDPDVITYRQEVVRDLVACSDLRDALAALLPQLETLAEVTAGVLTPRVRGGRQEGIEHIARRLIGLETFVDVVLRLNQALAFRLESRALRALQAELDQIQDSESFRALQHELPSLRATLNHVKSVTVGINLSPDLQPESATILEFGEERLDGRRSLLARLLGGGGNEALSPLQRGEPAPPGLQNELVRDLNQLLLRVAAPVGAALARYASISAVGLARLAPELAFLIGGAHLAQRMRAAGLPVCAPTLAPMDERISRLEDAYDPGLVLREAPDARVVVNQVDFGPTARVWVLTGPNRGGKTTYVRTVGVAHVLAQAGLLAPARSARLSPVDAIHTHFPTHEQAQPGMGRLDEEAERLAAIFRRATPHSLILLNEALGGTSSFEALDLARGIARGLRLLGARAIYVTHLHELASEPEVAAINARTPGDGVVGSLVAEPRAQDVGSREHTFQIRPGAPLGQSFAAAIAEQHGISFGQLEALLRQRGLLEPPRQVDG